MASSRRITKELQDLQKEPIQGITVEPNGDNLYSWTAVIEGPAESAYAGGKFELSLEFPIEYPFRAPKVKFNTRIYHPNVDDSGNLCVGLLKSESWKPSTKASTVLLTIEQLIAEPDPDDALVASIAEEFKSDRKQYEETAALWVKKYAQ